MSPTVFRQAGYRFFFFSREETRMHVHVVSEVGESKFWLEPTISMAQNHRHNMTQLNEIAELVEEHHDELVAAWKRHFFR
jgi:hypothetical protein